MFVCFKTSFVLVKNLNDKVILGLPFIHLLYPFTIEEDGITTTPFGQPVKFNFLNKIEQNIANLLKENLISQSICLINNKRQHVNFLNEEIKFKRLEQQLNCKIIRHSKSPWSFPAFYVQKNAELERGTPRLVINYKPLNKVLECIRYPIPNKQDLINRLSDSIVFSNSILKVDSTHLVNSALST
jgi:hypothetical protein